ALAVSRPPDPLDGVKTSIRLKNFAAAATELQKLAAAGNPDAQYLLAVFYLNGVNGPRDPATAKTWLEKAANKGSARAAFSLAALVDPALVAARDEFGRGALARAAEAASAPAVALLIRRGAPVEAPDQNGTTPLMIAARGGQPAAVDAVLAAHPNVNATDKNGNTALMH